MDTQAININEKKSNNQALKTGAAVVGAAAVGAGIHAGVDYLRNRETEEEVVVDPETVDPKTEEEVQATAETVTVETPVQTPTTPVSTPVAAGPVPQGAEDIVNTTVTTPTPAPAQTAETAEIETQDIPNVDPELIAHELTGDIQMVDPTDIDAETLAINSVGTIETVDGEVLVAAQFTGGDGTDLYMIDVDGDNHFDLVADNEGNVLTDVPGAITASDAENIATLAEGDTGYLAPSTTDTSDIAANDDIAADIVDLG